MSKYFSVNRPDGLSTLRLDSQGRATVQYTAKNLSGIPIDGRAVLVSLSAGPSGGPVERGWVRVDGSTDRHFDKDKEEVFGVTVAVPTQAAAGDHGFRLDMVNVARPDEGDQGPSIRFSVAATAAKRPRWPLYAGLIVAVLVVAGIAIWLLSRRSAAQATSDTTASASSQAPASSQASASSPAPASAPTPSPTPPPTTANDTLASDQALIVGQSITSQNNRYYLVMQGDGNLVAYDRNQGAIWASGTYGLWAAQHGLAVQAVMQGDGNLVLHNASGQGIWLSNSGGHSGCRLVMQNDGNLVIYQGATAVWASQTMGR